MTNQNPDHPVISACTLDCPDACSFLVYPDERLVRANPEHPITGKLICSKGRRAYERLNAPERIVHPLVRAGGKGQGGAKGKFVQTSWDDALNLIAQRLNALHDEPEAVLHVRGHGYRGVLAQASLHFFQVLGSSTIHGSLCDDAGIEACIRDFGALEHNDIRDLLHAARIVNWGKDLSRSSPHTAALVHQARKSGTRVLTISPGGDGNAAFSDATIRIRPGTDRFLAVWVMQGLLRQDLISDHIQQAASNWPEFKTLLTSWDPEELLRACEVDADQAAQLLEWYASPAPTASLIGWGLQRHFFGGQNVRMINALALVSGNIGRSGGGAYFNIASGRNLGQWSASSPGRQRTDDRRRMLLPTLAWELDWADPPVRFVWVDGHNVVNQVPDSLAMQAALQRPFVVCVDGFMTDTARCADVILPPAIMLEREDILGSCLHDFVNHAAQVVLPREEARADFDILRDLGARLDPPVSFPEPEECLQSGLRIVGMDLETFRRTGFAKAHHPDVAFAGLRFAHPDGLFCFAPELTPEAEQDPDYPLQLLSLIQGRYMHSQIPESAQRGLPALYCSPRNPQLRGADPERPFLLATPLGQMPVQLKLDPSLHPLTVIIRRDGWTCLGHGPNAVIEARETDMGHCTAYYSQCCRLDQEENHVSLP